MMAEPKECRICRIGTSEEDCDNGTPMQQQQSELFTPCACRGSMQYIHRTCLDRQRAIDVNNQLRCKVCQYEYRMTSTIVQRNARVLVWLLTFLSLETYRCTASTLVKTWMYYTHEWTTTHVLQTLCPTTNEVYPTYNPYFVSLLFGSFTFFRALDGPSSFSPTKLVTTTTLLHTLFIGRFALPIHSYPYCYITEEIHNYMAAIIFSVTSVLVCKMSDGCHHLMNDWMRKSLVASYDQ